MNVAAPQPAPDIPALTPQMTALRAAFLIASHHGITLAPEHLPSLTEADMAGAIRASLNRQGLHARHLNSCDWDRAMTLGSAYPALVPMRDGHFVILIQGMQTESGDMAAAILDPRREHDGVHLVTRDAFEAEWTGTLILVRRPRRLTDENQPFGLRWFIPDMIRQRRLLGGVVFAALIANLIGFSFPLLMQVLIDRVIAHQAWNTLMAVAAVFVLIATFDAVFSYVRQRLMMIAGGKIDARLGARVFAHMLSLPLNVFETTAAGVLARNVQQTEKLRHFLTGRLLQTLLDAALLPLLLLILALYSGLLTVVVLGFALAIAACIGALLPFYRRRLNALYAAEAERQSTLIETLHNMRAVKALVLEANRQFGWDASVAAAVRRQWDVGKITALVGTATGWLEKLMQIAVLAGGAVLVFQSQLSLGALVAFLMLSQRVTGPLVQIVGLINEYQEAALSVKLLASVMDHPSEDAGQARPARPPISGRMRFDAISFSYPGAITPALDRVSFDIEPGQVIGVVGRSGSGKTTLTRLIQGIETPQSGQILLDGIDLRHIDLGHLRRSIGVVLQENLLFRGTIRANISAARPEASFEAVVAAAQMAGADDFVRRMPMSYETPVEEGGANLSGGQRQRIAIARALLTAPSVLIFDEATSALDPESEALVTRNLADMSRGRTMLIISHRMSSLVRCNAILVLDQGQVVDFAPHDTLLDRCEIYRGLWRQQTEHLS